MTYLRINLKALEAYLSKSEPSCLKNLKGGRKILSYDRFYDRS